MTARRQGGPPASGVPVTLAEHLHVARRRAILYTASTCRGSKRLVARQLRISRPHLDKWIALYEIRAHFTTNRPRQKVNT
jgi:DNA-binding NtrC family response regulator